MSEHANTARIAPGMPVFDAMGAALGPVESSDQAAIRVQGREIPTSAIARVDATGVHLHLARAVLGAEASETAATDEGRIVIPLMEERLTVGTREVDLGEIIIRKRVIVEERMVPVTFRREEVEVIRREPGQSLPADHSPDTEVTRIPIRAWEPSAGTEPVVSREVVIDRDRLVEEGHVTSTVRRQHVTVDERYAQARPGLEREFMAGQQSSDRTFAEAEPQYRAGFLAGSDPQHSERAFEAVEPEIRRTLGQGEQQGGDSWQRLRREIQAGFEAARRG